MGNDQGYAIVTGGSRGIGAGMALKLAEMGYDVVATYVSNGSAAKAEAVCKQAEEQFGRRAIAIKADGGTFAGTEGLFKQAEDAFGKKLAVLVNNAGIAQDQMFTEIPLEKVDRIIDVNLKSVIYTCKLAIPLMKDNGGGCIINIASIGGMIPAPGQTIYSATKAGIIGMSRSLVVELAGTGIRVNCIAPGMVDTDIIKNLPDEAKVGTVQTTPLGRMGQVKDIVQAMEYIVGAEFLDGQVLSPNGGAFMP